MGIKIWPPCSYRPHKPHNFVIAFVIKMLKSFQNSISSKAKLNWREPPASAPPLGRSLHSITFKLTSRAHRCVGYRFFISSCGPTGSFSAAQPEMIGCEERKSDSGGGSNSKLTIFTPQPHPAAPLWSREELNCRALLSSWCWCKVLFFCLGVVVFPVNKKKKKRFVLWVSNLTVRCVKQSFFLLNVRLQE